MQTLSIGKQYMIGSSPASRYCTLEQTGNQEIMFQSKFGTTDAGEMFRNRSGGEHGFVAAHVQPRSEHMTRHKFRPKGYLGDRAESTGFRYYGVLP